MKERIIKNELKIKYKISFKGKDGNFLLLMHKLWKMISKNFFIFNKFFDWNHQSFHPNFPTNSIKILDKWVNK